jgi:hypothetical protein
MRRSGVRTMGFIIGQFSVALAVSGAIAVLLLASGASAEPLKDQHQGTEADCVGGVEWHFVHNQTAATEGVITVGAQMVANGEPFTANVLHYWVHTSGNVLPPDVSDNVEGGELLLSHLTCDPATTTTTTAATTTTTAPTTTTTAATTTTTTAATTTTTAATTTTAPTTTTTAATTTTTEGTAATTTTTEGTAATTTVPTQVGGAVELAVTGDGSILILAVAGLILLDLGYLATTVAGHPSRRRR